MKLGAILVNYDKQDMMLKKIDSKSIIFRNIEALVKLNINRIYIIIDNESYRSYVKEEFNVEYLFNNYGTKGAIYCLSGLINEEDEVFIVNSNCYISNYEVFFDLCDKCFKEDKDIGIIENYNKDKLAYYFRGNQLINLFKKIKQYGLEEILINDKTLTICEKEKLFNINNYRDLMKVTKLYYQNNCFKLLECGVQIIDVNNTYISENVMIGEGSVIYPNNYILGKSSIGNNSVVHPNCYIEDSVIGQDCFVGPFAHLKCKAFVGDNCVIGAFVEVKNSKIKNGVKAKHHAYLGDVEVGEKSNIGCGTIVANYDGKKKHKSKLGDKCFIGSNVTLVSPINVGNNCVIGAGSTIVENVEDNSLAIARSRQINKKDYYLKD